MTRRPAVWEPRGDTEAEVMPEWEVAFTVEGIAFCGSDKPIRAPHAFDAWKQVHGAPAFGSCRVRKIEQEK